MKKMKTGLMLAACLCMAVGTQAQTLVYWDGATGPWETASNWAGDTLPAATEGFRVNNGGIAQLGSAQTVQTVHLGTSPGESGTLDIGSGGSLTVMLNDNVSFGHNNGTGTVNIVAGSFNMANDNAVVRLGRYGDAKGTLNLSGTGAFNGGRLFIGGNGAGVLDISDSATLNLDGYLVTGKASSSIYVRGSDATIIVARFAVDSPGTDTLTFFMDAGGNSLIDAVGTASSSYNGAALNDLAIVLEDEGTFVANVGDTFDLIRSATVITTNSSFSLVENIAGYEFSHAIVADGGDTVLRMTVIPEPAALGLVAFAGGVMFWIRRTFMI